MSSAPLLSVVVCTHNRLAELERCLAALAACAGPLEVVVVDSASTPPIAEHARVRAAVAALEHASILRVEEPGLSRARNAGAARATCDLVAFVDDDAFVRPDWAHRLLPAFARPDVACVGGSCEALFESERPEWLSDRLLQFAGATRFDGVPRAARRGRELPFGANMAFRKHHLFAVGGFDEELGRNGGSLLSGEESAVMEKLVRCGKTVWLQPDAVVDHLIQPQRTEPGWYWSRMWWSGIGRARARQGWTTLPRLCAAAPIRAIALLATGDRVYLYRLAESAGFLAERSRKVRRAASVAGRRKAAG